MDIGGDAGLPIGIAEQNDPNQPNELNINDVFEAISLADPTFGEGPPPVALENMASQSAPPRAPSVVIVEQPASKALRFRYKCEGRSAGSLPGVSSTPENKTYPTIKICSYKGPATIVVSCVNKDPPFKPHPHNLVGRERCDRGVCSVRTDVTEDNNEYQFRNLGIQCVKRKDIVAELRLREELRVDPFRTGFDHRSHTQSIDLNAVRLAFQVFVPDGAGRMRRPLPAVVSDIIYDKKAMSDLLIMRSSHCSGTIRGGTQVILLCEKVSKEDTAVIFYQEVNEQIVWEETVTPSYVHKQVAVVFNTPPYRDPQRDEHVTVHFQLKRLTDDARSNSFAFEYIPDFRGTTRRKPPPDLSFLSLLLAEKRDTNNNNKDEAVSVPSSPDPVPSPPPPDPEPAVAETNGHAEPHEKSLDDLLEQVAELDEIYSESRSRLQRAADAVDTETDADDFNDAGTYTSLQLAFKNPLPIAEPEPPPYEDVHVQTFRGPIVEFTPLKRDTDEAPPLPPKRVRKSVSSEFRSSQTSVESAARPARLPPPDEKLSAARSEPALPPAKKRSFFSRLFRRRDKSPAPSVQEARARPVGRSVSSVSGQRPARWAAGGAAGGGAGGGLRAADSVTHVSLHEDVSVCAAPPADAILVAESVLALDASSFRRLQDELELTEAEHYALYMALAPRATASEFDDQSSYYSPLDGSNFLRQ
ncbi:embryonic polarity protein dorsal isoform X1 [Bombyx mandarina]|uniref:Embryonic polarity protein dorsal isoform X1 n=1 Tax=Bombyx mandarina TaxID=7092 RepID=A0A6J2JNC4_BOMMA|nr:embryonic polarity protein dorsal isoform X1 [Bombyx mandarina]